MDLVKHIDVLSLGVSEMIFLLSIFVSEINRGGGEVGDRKQEICRKYKVENIYGVGSKVTELKEGGRVREHVVKALLQ